MQAFLAVYKMDGSSWECSAFTRPGCRNQGYFHALLEQACRDSQEEGGPDLCFVTDNRCPDTLKAVSYTHLDVYKRQVDRIAYCHKVFLIMERPFP